MATAVELVARVRVQGAEKFQRDIKKSEQEVHRLGQSARRAGSAIMRGLASPLAVITGIAGGAAGFGFLKFLSDSGKEMDTFRRRFAAFQGSFAQADQTIAFIRQLAQPSVFEFKDLAEAGGLLAAYGLNVQKVLPLTEQLASAFGDTGESVSEIARVFGRLKSGDFGEAFERLRDFGIGFDDLRKKGLEFSKSNEFLGTRMEALAAVSSIIIERYGRINDIMRDSAAAKFASAMDSLRSAAAEAGQIMLRYVTPGVERITNFVNFLRESNFVGVVIERWAGAFQQIFGTGLQEGIDRFLSFAAALAYEFPAAMVAIRDAVRDTFINITDSAAEVYNAFVTIGVGVRNAFMAAVTEVKNFVNKIVTEIKNAMIDIENVGIRVGNANPFTPDQPLKSRVGFQPETATALDPSQFFTSGSKIRGGIGNFFTKDFAGLQGTADSIFQRFQGFRPSPGFTGGGGGGAFLAGGDDTDLMRSTRRIEENTHRNAIAAERMVDLTRSTLGGGALGAMGVTPVEFRSFRQGNTPQVKVEFKGNYRSVQDMFQDVAQQIVTQALRSGQLAGRR